MESGLETGRVARRGSTAPSRIHFSKSATTAAGNILAQAIAAGAVKNLAEARQIVRNSFDTTRYEPNPLDAIEAARTRFNKL